MAELDIATLDRRAVQLSEQIVGQAGAADLDRPTPCAGWTLTDLLEHMIVQHAGFAAASRGHGGDPQVWVPARHDDPVAAYGPAARDVIAAFAEPGVAERRFALPEISPALEFPAAQAISFHFVDYVVHSWDVAAALGLPLTLDDDLARAALAVARRVPDGPQRLSPGAAFAPGLPLPDDDGDTLTAILAVLGRSSTWTGDPARQAR